LIEAVATAIPNWTASRPRRGFTRGRSAVKAVDTAWTVYLATHRDVDVANGRRCLLERPLQGRLKASQSETEELTCSGLAYLDRLAKDE
jgi:hypothetical protein